jgi:hypothetical protein
MAEKKELGIFRIDYELLPSMSTWTAFIGAFSHEEALLFLRRKVGAHRLISSGIQSRVDALSDEVRNVIINQAIGKQIIAGPKEEATTKVEVPVKGEEKQPVVTEKKKSSFNRK